MNTTISAENCVLVFCLATGWAVLTLAKELLIPLASLVITLAGWQPAPPPAAVLPIKAQPATTVSDIKVSNFAVQNQALARYFHPIHLQSVLAATPEPILQSMAKLAQAQNLKSQKPNLS